MFARNCCKLLKFPTTTYTNTNIRLIRYRNPLLRRSFFQKPSSTTKGVYEPVFRKLWRNLFGKYLFTTNVISSGLLMVVGDALAQFIEIHGDENRNLDYDRICRMFVVGAVQGPLHHWVYNWMDHVMPVRNLKNTLKKILIDQLFMSPACILLFYYTACYLEHKCLNETNEELLNNFPLIYAFDWLLWPGAQYINFRYLETKYRVLFVNVCTALYNVFISYVKHDSTLKDTEKVRKQNQ